MTLGEARVAIRADLKPLRWGLRTGLNIVKSGMRKIVRTVKILSAAMVASITASMVVWSKFRKQLAMVSTMLTAETMPLMKEYSEGILRLTKQTGQSTKTLSKGLYDILSASIDTSKALDVLEVSVKAGIAGMSEAGVAADLITTILNSYQMKAERAAEVSDKLFSTIKRGKTTFPELANSLGMVTSTAALAGMNLDELLAIIATLTRGGIKTSRAVFAINNALRAFLSPGDAAKDMAKKIGVELSTATLKTEGLVASIKKFKRASAEQLAVIFPNIRGFKAIAGALQDTIGLQKDFTLISEESAGTTSDAYEKMTQDLGFQFSRAKAYIKAVAISFGDAVGPRVQRMFDALIKKIGNFDKWIKENEEIINYWAAVAEEKVGDVIAYFENLLAIIKDKDWMAAFNKLGLDISEMMKKAFVYLEPKAIALGKAMAKGFSEAVKTGAKGLREEHPVATNIAAGAGIAWLSSKIIKLGRDLTKATSAIGKSGIGLGKTGMAIGAEVGLAGGATFAGYVAALSLIAINIKKITTELKEIVPLGKRILEDKYPGWKSGVKGNIEDVISDFRTGKYSPFGQTIFSGITGRLTGKIEDNVARSIEKQTKLQEAMLAELRATSQNNMVGAEF